MMQGCTLKIPSLFVRARERSKLERKNCYRHSEFFKLTGIQNFLSLLEVHIYKVCFCFKYPDGLDQFDHLKTKRKNSELSGK